ncbi:MAG: hypothetical protein ACXVNO_00060 [Bacteroidia bacterium]
MFAFEMQPNKSSFFLDSGKIYKICGAWIEQSCKLECIRNRPKLVKDNYYQFVISTLCNEEKPWYYYKNYYLWQSDFHSGFGLLSENSSLYKEQDTLTLYLTKHLPKTADHAKTVMDTIKFVKKKVSR